MDVNELQSQNIGDLTKFAQDLEIEKFEGLSKQELILNILEAQNKKEGIMQARGVLEVLKEGYGFLRSPDFNYLPGPDDIYVSPSQVRKFNLRTGDNVEGEIRAPKDSERYFALLKVNNTNESDPEKKTHIINFDNLIFLILNFTCFQFLNHNKTL